MIRQTSIKIVLSFIILFQILLSQQIDIDRIELIPGSPSDYELRDWKRVTLGYDSLVFDLSATGTYLPLIWTDGNSVNYPDHDRFGLQSYVGSPAVKPAEAINVIPAVISATLVGIDKSNQDGVNWVEMCEEFFNKRETENVYLNNFVTSSGNDWWYDTMPNIFFYQLYHFYPDEGDFHYQFSLVADRWLEAIDIMGGNTMPWSKANMNHRAWRLSTMTPNDDGVKEPEAAGALAWMMYMAYSETGEEKYRIGAEWAIEFLDESSINPFYELQLPYGAYIAARMNAELGTDYNIEKMVDWCFTIDGNVRSWGMTLGNWNGYDCYGLIGEAVNDGYAFSMNGYEHLGALAPMVRYDDRFARAMGKWALHLVNASRLFYTDYLPDSNQDSETWGHQYDSSSYIGYEALREFEWFGDTSPFATGDAKKGGWASTNYGLYGSSHIGILGAIVDTTNIEKILKLDLTITDYFRSSAYPTFLFYNPFASDTAVTFNLPAGTFDVYDAVSNAFLVSGVSGTSSITIPADMAVVAVLTPPGGNAMYILNTLYVDSVAVDYFAGQSVTNYPPRIKSLDTKHFEIPRDTPIDLFCTSEDRDLDVLTYTWKSDSGSFTGSGSQVQWSGISTAGLFVLSCTVTDGNGGADSTEISIEVLSNFPPEINKIEITPGEVDINGTASISCDASDIDNDSLYYYWTAEAGSFAGTGESVEWTAPGDIGMHWIKCRVEDQYGGFAIDSSLVTVGFLVADLRFSGNANDSSGFGNHGSVTGAQLTEDRFGNANSAYLFDGVDDYIRITNSSSMNFENAITVVCWMRIDEFFATREAYPISHGNWQNRWKISITNGGIRWTVNSSTGIKDIDSNIKLSLDNYYFVACTFNGSSVNIYIDGQPDNNASFTGIILPTTIDLTIAQALPNESNYNFKGIIDDILIYNKALTANEILDLYGVMSDIDTESENRLPATTMLFQNYPNPFNPSTKMKYQLARAGNISLKLYDISGRLVDVVFQGKQNPGIYTYLWDGSGKATGVYFMVLNTAQGIDVKKFILIR